MDLTWLDAKHSRLAARTGLLSAPEGQLLVFATSKRFTREGCFCRSQKSSEMVHARCHVRARGLRRLFKSGFEKTVHGINRAVAESGAWCDDLEGRCHKEELRFASSAASGRLPVINSSTSPITCSQSAIKMPWGYSSYSMYLAPGIAAASFRPSDTGTTASARL